MKSGLATSLSIAGVLATGGAALVLNSSILDTESSAKGSPAFATVVGLQSDSGVMPLGGGAAPRSAADLSANTVADIISGEQAPRVAPVEVSVDAQSTPASTSVTQSAGNAGAPANAPATEKQFKVGDAATITLVARDTKLLVKNILITSGSSYRVTNQVSRDGDDARITLTSPTRAIEFSARIVNGQIMAAVSAPSSGNLNPPRPPRHDDDDDDDDNHHGRHEDGDHPERDHDDDD